MRIAFIVHRLNAFKIFGPIIDEALRIGWDVECWLINEEMDSKNYLKPSMNNLPLFQSLVNVHVCNSYHEIKERAKISNTDALFSIFPKSKYLDDENTSPFFVTIQNGIDLFVNSSLNELSSSDLIVLYSLFWVDWGARYYQLRNETSYENAYSILEQKSIFPGAPQLDQFSRMDNSEIRKNLGIQRNKPIVLMLPMTLGNKGGVWPRFFEADSPKQQAKILLKGLKARKVDFFAQHWTWPIRKWSDGTLTEKVREFANINNALLVIKGREKDPIRDWAAKLADYISYDESYYPATIYQLLAISNVCIHFYSTAALEAAYANVIGITIDRPSPSVEFGKKPPLYHELWRTGKTGTAFNFPGVNQWMKIPQVMKHLPFKQLKEMEIDPTDRETYLQQYLGSNGERASERLLETLAEIFSANHVPTGG